MIWFTSDLHLGHRAVINFQDRPFGTVEEMNEALIKNWNFLVAIENLRHTSYLSTHKKTFKRRCVC